LWEAHPGRLCVLSVLREEVAMRGAGKIVVTMLVALFAGAFVYGASMAYLEAAYAASALKLELAAPVKLDVDWMKGKIAVVLAMLIKNTGSRSIDIEGGKYRLYIGHGIDSYVLAEGSFSHIYVNANSRQIVPVSVELNLLQLPKTLQSILKARSGYEWYIEVTLNMPIKFMGIKLGVYPVTITKQLQ
jgi:LEA14-like dessication related protein